MEARAKWSRGLSIAGLVLLLVGLIDPLEGFPVVLAGGVLAVIAARMATSRWLRLVAWGLGLAAVGSAAMVVLSWLGGIGGARGLPMVWGLVVLPYPVGLLLVLIAAVLLTIDLFRAPRVIAGERRSS